MSGFRPDTEEEADIVAEKAERFARIVRAAFEDELRRGAPGEDRGAAGPGRIALKGSDFSALAYALGEVLGVFLESLPGPARAQFLDLMLETAADAQEAIRAAEIRAAQRERAAGARVN